MNISISVVTNSGVKTDEKLTPTNNILTRNISTRVTMNILVTIIRRVRININFGSSTSICLSLCNIIGVLLAVKGFALP